MQASGKVRRVPIERQYRSMKVGLWAIIIAVGFFDEFGSYANDKVMDVLAKAWSAKFGAVLGAQSISDFEVVDPNMVKRVFDNVNVYLLGRTNSAENAEIITKSIGTYEDIDRTIMT